LGKKSIFWNFENQKKRRIRGIYIYILRTKIRKEKSSNIKKKTEKLGKTRQKNPINLLIYFLKKEKK
jgi:hypothetical protein